MRPQEGSLPDAAELALRVLDPEAQAEAEAALNAGDRAKVARMETQLGRLALAVPDEMPPPELFARVLAAVRTAAAPDQGTLTVRAGEGHWEAMGPGVLSKLVWEDHNAGRRGMLVRMDPGAVYPAHSHDRDEECLVLEGELRFGDLPLAAGDFHYARKGYRHPDALSRRGCLLYISGGF